MLERDGGSEMPLRPMSPNLQHTLTVNIPASATLHMRNSCPAITMTTPFTIKPRDYSFVSDGNAKIKNIYVLTFLCTTKCDNNAYCTKLINCSLLIYLIIFIN